MADFKGEKIEKDGPTKKILFYHDTANGIKQLSSEIYKKVDQIIHYPRGFEGGDKYKTIKKFIYKGFKGKLPVGVVKSITFGWGFTKTLNPFAYYLNDNHDIEEVIVEKNGKVDLDLLNKKLYLNETSLETLQNAFSSIFKKNREEVDFVLKTNLHILFPWQIEDGQLLEIDLNDERICIENFLKTPNECNFYFEGLKENGWIDYEYKGAFRITHLGLNVAIALQSEGNNSNKCFIAMAFKNETQEYREAIKRALSKTGFEPVIIDEEHLASDKTIPDGILAGIKKSKFCIADFTFHRNGVYFESGYALGLGKQVIYLCKKDEFDKAHFDIQQLQHIIYENADELQKRLTEKIEAWIK